MERWHRVNHQKFPANTATATSTATPGGNLLPAGYLHTSGTQIVDATNTPVRLAGVNWYGFECEGYVAGGLDHQTVDTICGQIVTLGFNTVRLPFSVELYLSNPVVTSYLDANPNLAGRHALDIMYQVIKSANAHGLKVILDNHRSEAGWSWESNGLWYTQAYDQSTWVNVWKRIVQDFAVSGGRYYTGAVIGCDLRNELASPPKDSSVWPANNGSVWGYTNTNPTYHATTNPDDWSVAATTAGNAILGINPDLLIFVEGIRWDPAGPIFNGSHYTYWPGGNLMGSYVAAPNYNQYINRPSPVPIKLQFPDGSPANTQLVYSAHDYGPDMYSGLAWCQLDSSGNGTGATPDACDSVWDQTWGADVLSALDAPIWIGEFGTRNGDANQSYPPSDYTDTNSDYVAQGYWFTYLVDYIQSHNLSWCYWALNGTQSYDPSVGRYPSDTDWYGILTPDWSRPASQPMMDKLTTIQ